MGLILKNLKSFFNIKDNKDNKHNIAYEYNKQIWLS